MAALQNSWTDNILWIGSLVLYWNIWQDGFRFVCTIKCTITYVCWKPHDNPGGMFYKWFIHWLCRKFYSFRYTWLSLKSVLYTLLIHLELFNFPKRFLLEKVGDWNWKMINYWKTPLNIEVIEVIYLELTMTILMIWKLIGCCNSKRFTI